MEKKVVVPMNRIETSMKDTMKSMNRPELIVCVHPRAMVFSGILQSNFGSNIVYEGFFSDNDRLTNLLYVTDKMVDRSKRVLLVDAICNIGKRLAVATGNNVETFAFCVDEESLFVPTYKCFKSPKGVEILFPWEEWCPKRGVNDDNEQAQNKFRESSSNESGIRETRGNFPSQ